MLDQIVIIMNHTDGTGLKKNNLRVNKSYVK